MHRSPHSFFRALIKIFVFKNTTAISVPEYNFHVTEENTFFIIPVSTCHSCYFWLVTGMTVTGMTKSMQTRIYFAFWKQKLKYVYTVLLRPMIPFQCLDIILISAFCSSKKVGNRDDI